MSARRGKSRSQESVSRPESESRIRSIARAAATEVAWSAGDCKPSFRQTPESGWLLCDGSAVSRETYADLFAAIGTTHGAGNGTTTFNVPNVPGRALVGAGTGSGLTTRLLGSLFGAETVVLSQGEMPAHTHGGATQSGGTHDHTVYANQTDNTTATGSFNRLNNLLDPPGGGGSSAATTQHSGHTHSIPSAGSGGAHANVGPSIAINVFIKV